jgi:predicted TIM-barrel fold metal-dependent hydrolase
MTLPALACDCHVHLFGPRTRYPFDEGRVYTPGDADEAALEALHRRLGVSRVVLVQPSVYGSDNRRLVDGLKRLGPRARAVAVIAEDAGDDELISLHRAGVRGVRVNLSTLGLSEPLDAWHRIATQASRVASLGWHVQVLTKAPVIAALAEKLATLPCPLVIDHFGQPDLAAGADAPAFRAILGLVADGRAVVKLSAMQRLAGAGGFDGLTPFVAALAEADPAGMVWGTDWPHTGGGRGFGHLARRPVAEIEPFEEMDDRDGLAALLAMLPGEAIRRAAFTDNAARLYGFSEETA